MSAKRGGLVVRVSINEGITKVMTVDFSDAISHGAIVSELAVLVSRQLGMDDAFCEKIAPAAMLHDIGKLRLAEHLHKERSEAMVVEKMKYVRMHAALSCDIMREQGYDKELQDMVYHHHENYDGSGYPANIAGEDIPPGARIIRVCDVYAALISDRSYRKAFSEKTAVELMIDEVRHFDMKVFLAFLKVIHSDEYAKVQNIIRGGLAECASDFFEKEVI